ncbi:hypothetical protein [Bradyrhizobium sp. WU425]|uniref:hypothetical protein n=1 Tax=Bradyrhizobium sp. WU425 TaxID=187029 RepID=UPI001E5F578D|nr:hypothetical protein [Bradyrhizobium canariense]UFW69205.1 hypothetical protein BcanWU425_20785 [Bradyrhizobium canariense]
MTVIDSAIGLAVHYNDVPKLGEHSANFVDLGNCENVRNYKHSFGALGVCESTTLKFAVPLKIPDAAKADAKKFGSLMPITQLRVRR